MKRRFFSFILTLAVFSQALFSEQVISDFTRQKVEEFITSRIGLKDQDDEIAYRTILQMKDEALKELPAHALDQEQEECILESLYYLEYYEHSLASSGNQKELRSEMKKLMKRDMACIENRKEGQISEWLYQFTGDVTSYYMTRSVAATFFYGLSVKGYYEKAIEVNPKRVSAHVCLGNWRFYAPFLFGGGKGRAKRHFDDALDCAELPGEKYMAYIASSQIRFEKGDKEEAEKYLQMAFDLNLGRKELDTIAKCNKKGYSYYQYLRNRSGIDEEMAEDEKDEEDK
ncbi:hypothetical protein [uncultured Treponema sp.]|uniref:hypothetical protein n=1 Tax=uncultured Treponema sp. TaxID=162155 RepID=UPI0026033638|nr:hypothetical protein [uncultured Treponema sp.]